MSMEYVKLVKLDTSYTNISASLTVLDASSTMGSLAPNVKKDTPFSMDSATV